MLLEAVYTHGVSQKRPSARVRFHLFGAHTGAPLKIGTPIRYRRHVARSSRRVRWSRKILHISPQ